MWKTKTDDVTPAEAFKVGCQTVVFQSKDEMLNEIGKYLANPKETEKFYRENTVNKSLLTEPEDEVMMEEGSA